MFKNKKILAIILARSGSKGIINKNIKKIKKKPLLSYTAQFAKKLKILDKVIISTDSLKFQKIAYKDGVESPFLRSKILSKDNVPDDICLLDGLLKCEKFYKTRFDIVVSLPPTSPLRKKRDVIGAIKKCINKNLDSVWTISKIDSKYHPLKVLNLKNLKLTNYLKKGSKIFRRQQLDTVYIRNGSAYVIKADYLKKNKKILSKNSEGYITLGKQISIDTIEDLNLSRLYL